MWMGVQKFEVSFEAIVKESVKTIVGHNSKKFTLEG